MRDLPVEQYHMVQPKQNGLALTQLRKKLPSEASQEPHGKTTREKAKLHNSMLTTTLSYRHIHHPRPCLGKLDTDTSQTAPHKYKTHAMTTYHRGAWHACKDRDRDSHVEDARNIDIEPAMNMKTQTAQILQLLSEDQRQIAALATSNLTARQTWTYSPEK